MHTFLLVEPHVGLRQSLQDWLYANLSGCAIVAATDLAQAIALAADQPPNVMLLDLDTITTVELHALLRLSQFSQCRVIGLGLDDTLAHRQRAAQLGLAYFFPKAGLEQDLIPALQRLTRE